MKVSLFTGLLAASIGIGLSAFDPFAARPTVVGKHAADNQSTYYWYYVEPDGQVYDYSAAFSGPRTLAYASLNGGCFGNFMDCMRGFLYQPPLLPTSMAGDVTILKAF